MGNKIQSQIPIGGQTSASYIEKVKHGQELLESGREDELWSMCNDSISVEHFGSTNRKILNETSRFVGKEGLRNYLKGLNDSNAEEKETYYFDYGTGDHLAVRCMNSNISLKRTGKMLKGMESMQKFEFDNDGQFKAWKLYGPEVSALSQEEEDLGCIRTCVECVPEMGTEIREFFEKKIMERIWEIPDIVAGSLTWDESNHIVLTTYYPTLADAEKAVEPEQTQIWERFQSMMQNPKDFKVTSGGWIGDRGYTGRGSIALSTYEFNEDDGTKVEVDRAIQDSNPRISKIDGVISSRYVWLDEEKTKLEIAVIFANEAKSKDAFGQLKHVLHCFHQFKKDTSTKTEPELQNSLSFMGVDGLYIASTIYFRTPAACKSWINFSKRFLNDTSHTTSSLRKLNDTTVEWLQFTTPEKWLLYNESIKHQMFEVRQQLKEVFRFDMNYGGTVTQAVRDELVQWANEIDAITITPIERATSQSFLPRFSSVSPGFVLDATLTVREGEVEPFLDYIDELVQTGVKGKGAFMLTKLGTRQYRWVEVSNKKQWMEDDRAIMLSEFRSALLDFKCKAYGTIDTELRTSLMFWGDQSFCDMAFPTQSTIKQVTTWY